MSLYSNIVQSGSKDTVSLMFSAGSKVDESVRLNFSLDEEAVLAGEDDEDLINSPPSQCSDSHLF